MWTCGVLSLGQPDLCGPVVYLAWGSLIVCVIMCRYRAATGDDQQKQREVILDGEHLYLLASNSGNSRVYILESSFNGSVFP